MRLKFKACFNSCHCDRIYVPVGWQIYARHGKASGPTFFSDKPTVVFTTIGVHNDSVGRGTTVLGIYTLVLR